MGDGEDGSAATATLHRRQALQSIVMATTAAFLPNVDPSWALVKGNAPPPKKSKTEDPDKIKCVNVEECQTLAEQREQELREKEMASMPPPKVTSSGIRYRDMVLADSDEAAQVKDGDNVEIYYKVLKLGKRSFDGLSGEGTVVFSRGYGMEDDENKPGEKSFQTTIGALTNIAALNEAVVGMKIGDVRRFAIVPQKGWRKPIAACDGGPGGSGSGGELRTDYVVVPTATMVDQEVCFDQTKKPFPVTYAQQRRMAQRFDQSLIMEVQVVGIGGK